LKRALNIFFAKVKEKTMANKKFFVGMLVMALVFGMVVVGCEDGSTGGGDPALNGTWVAYDFEWKFNSGSWEFSYNGTPSQKGNYTATPSTGSLTITPTHFWGGNSEGMLESKWYTKSELKTAVKNLPMGADLSDAEIDAQLDLMFGKQTGTYSLSGTNLTLNVPNFYSGTYAKKN
jgi:hypothetical protein